MGGRKSVAQPQVAVSAITRRCPVRSPGLPWASPFLVPRAPVYVVAWPDALGPPSRTIANSTIRSSLSTRSGGNMSEVVVDGFRALLLADLVTYSIGRSVRAALSRVGTVLVRSMRRFRPVRAASGLRFR